MVLLHAKVVRWVKLYQKETTFLVVDISCAHLKKNFMLINFDIVALN